MQTTDQPAPTGKTSLKWYRTGYLQALHDIRLKLEEGGEDAVAEWINNNA